MLHGKKGFERIVWACKNVLDQSLTWLYAERSNGKEQTDPNILGKWSLAIAIPVADFSPHFFPDPSSHFFQFLSPYLSSYLSPHLSPNQFRHLSSPLNQTLLFSRLKFIITFSFLYYTSSHFPRSRLRYKSFSHLPACYFNSHCFLNFITFPGPHHFRHVYRIRTTLIWSIRSNINHNIRLNVLC